MTRLMALHQHLLIVAALLSLQSAGDVAGQQFTAPTPTCPGETFTFTCTIVGNRSGFTLWRVGGSADCILAHSTAAAPAPCGSATAFTVTAGTGFGATGPSFASFTSTLSGTATTSLNDTRVECFPDTSRNPENRVGDSNLQVVAPPTAPGTPSVTFPSQGQQFTITWNEPTLSMGGTVDTYFVNVSGPNDLCGSTNTRQRVTTHSYTCLEWTMPTGQRYIFTVQAANCGGSQRGPESDPVIVYLQTPNPPTLTATPLYDSSGGLLEIESHAMATEGSPVTIADGVDGSPTEYIFSYNGAPFPASTGLTPQCSNSSCQHVFNDTSSQAQQYTVSAAAKNVVGIGTASTPVIIDSTNTVFNVTVDFGVHEVTCQFLNGTVSSATCTVHYGTDPTYMNLPNTDSSTGTNVNRITVSFSTPLQADTLYYYVVSSMGVRMQGTFRSGCTLPDLGVVDTTPDERCIRLQNSAQFAGGVVCYSGVIPGSIAVYVCNSTHHLDGPRFRECQSNGNWSGSVPQCVADHTTGSVPEPAICGLSPGAAVGISITIFLVSFSAGAVLAALITYCCMRRRGKSSGQPHLSPSEGPLPAPVYDEVGTDKLELKENVAYGPVRR